MAMETYTIEEAAKALGIQPHSVVNLRARGIIESAGLKLIDGDLRAVKLVTARSVRKYRIHTDMIETVNSRAAEYREIEQAYKQAKEKKQ